MTAFGVTKVSISTERHFAVPVYLLQNLKLTYQLNQFLQDWVFLLIFRIQRNCYQIYGDFRDFFLTCNLPLHFLYNLLMKAHLEDLDSGVCGITSKSSSHYPCQSNRTNDETALGFLDQFFMTYLCNVKNNAPQVSYLFFSLRNKWIFKQHLEHLLLITLILT